MTLATIGSVRRIQFWQQHANGVLTVFPGDDAEGVPFPIARIFTIAQVTEGGARADHAHRNCAQLLVCLTGRIDVTITDGKDTTTLEVRADGSGLLIPPMLWNTVRFEGPATALMVICDRPYEASDYIRGWQEFLELRSLSPVKPRLSAASQSPASKADAGPPELLDTIIQTSRRAFGYFDEFAPYRIMYPWVAHHLRDLPPHSRILDLGAGVNPLPVVFAERHMQVDTVDSSPIMRALPRIIGGNGWGYLDYSKIDPRISSWNCPAEGFHPSAPYAAAYSVSMLAHIAKADRNRVFVNLLSWLEPGGRFLFTLDIVPGSDFVWNRREGVEVEPLGEHGTVGDVRQTLEHLDFRIDQFVVLRGLEGTRTDILLTACCRP